MNLTAELDQVAALATDQLDQRPRYARFASNRIQGPHTLILWSGGLDSTYLVYEALRRGEDVVAVYFEIENNVHKTRLETRTLGLLAPLLRELFPQRQLELHLGGRTQVNMTRGHVLTLSQVPMWLHALAYSIRAKTERVQAGYVAGDSIIDHLDQVRMLYLTLGQFFNCPAPPLQFPLVARQKADLLAELPAGVRALVVTCENPKPRAKYAFRVKHHDRDHGGRPTFWADYAHCARCQTCQNAIEQGLHELGAFPDLLAAERKHAQEQAELERSERAHAVYRHHFPDYEALNPPGGADAHYAQFLADYHDQGVLPNALTPTLSLCRA